MATNASFPSAGPGGRPPDVNAGEDAQVADVFRDSPPSDDALLSGDFPTELLEAREGVEAVLRGQGERRNRVQSMEEVVAVGNIQGVAIGLPGASAYGVNLAGLEPGRPALTVYLAEPQDPRDVRALIVEEMGVRAAGARNVAVTPVVTGLIQPHSHHFKFRPATGGLSCGQVEIGGSGTLGCLATGRSAPRNERTLILSNNHVLANANLAAINSCVVQPGVGDGGTCESDQVAVLERFYPLSFGGGAVNYVDCATAWAWPERVSPKMMYLAATGATPFSISPMPVGATQGMVVGKSGRTTQLTSGTIAEVGASTWVGPYAGGGSAFFAGQLAIEGGPFSAPGDSGSLVWTWNAGLNPVGLVFAGGGAGARSFANQIGIVLSALDIHIVA